MFDEKKTARPRGTDSAEVIQVIVTKTKVGSGTEEDPNRFVTEYWSFDGELLALNDPARIM